MKKELSVVILNWNGRNLLEQFLPSVVAFTPLEVADIIVADNGSTDDSLAFLTVNYPQIKQIVLGKNFGFAQGYNLALSEINTPLALLLNSDVAVTEHWLTPLLAYMHEHPQVAACQPKIRAYNNPTRFEHAGAAGGYVDKYGFPYCRGRVLNYVEEDNGQYDEPVTIFWASGAAMLVRTDLYFAVGGLDERFFAHHEEIDLCWRMQLTGGEIAAVPQSVVYHKGGATLGVENPRKTYLNFRNNLLMLYKNLPLAISRNILRKRFFIDAAAYFMFLFKGEFSHAKAVVNAYRDFKKMKKYYTPTTVNGNLLKTQAAGRHSFLIHFYFKREKCFSQIVK